MFIFDEILAEAKDKNLLCESYEKLLKDFNLPTCKVYKPGNIIDAGRTYLEGNYTQKAITMHITSKPIMRMVEITIF